MQNRNKLAIKNKLEQVHEDKKRVRKKEGKQQENKCRCRGSRGNRLRKKRKEKRSSNAYVKANYKMKGEYQKIY